MIFALVAAGETDAPRSYGGGAWGQIFTLDIFGRKKGIFIEFSVPTDTR